MDQQPDTDIDIDTDIDPEDLQDLAIFPLPNVVLFPGALLPLHIFEARYRAMTRDVLDDSKLLAMTRLRSEALTVSDRSPSVFPVAGLGRIAAAKELEDGRYYLLMRGVARVSICEELDTGSDYRRVRAELRPDVIGQPHLAAATEQLLVQLCDELADRVEGARDLREVVREAETAGGCADLVAATIVRDADERQSLLEMRDPGDRLERLLELVSEAMHKLGLNRHLN